MVDTQYVEILDGKGYISRDLGRSARGSLGEKHEVGTARLCCCAQFLGTRRYSTTTMTGVKRQSDHRPRRTTRSHGNNTLVLLEIYPTRTRADTLVRVDYAAQRLDESRDHSVESETARQRALARERSVESSHGACI
jgi:hypothetical protein